MPEERPIVFNEYIQRKDGLYITEKLQGSTARTLTNYGVFFIARFPMEIMWASCAWEAAAGDPCTLNMEILSDGEALASGDEVLVTPWDLEDTADISYPKEGSAFTTTRIINPNERLALKPTGASPIASVLGVQVTVYLKFAGRGDYL